MKSLLLSRVRRYAALDRPRGDRAQRYPDRPLLGPAMGLRSYRGSGRKRVGFVQSELFCDGNYLASRGPSLVPGRAALVTVTAPQSTSQPTGGQELKVKARFRRAPRCESEWLPEQSTGISYRHQSAQSWPPSILFLPRDPPRHPAAPSPA